MLGSNTFCSAKTGHVNDGLANLRMSTCQSLVDRQGSGGSEAGAGRKGHYLWGRREMSLPQLAHLEE